jgi:hypothetical protein
MLDQADHHGVALSGEHPPRGSPGNPSSAPPVQAGMLGDDRVANPTTVAPGAVNILRSMEWPRFTFSEVYASFMNTPLKRRKSGRNSNLTHLRGGTLRPRYADFECNLCAQGTLANTKLRGTPQELAAFPSFWQLPDAPPVVLDRRAHLHDFLSFSIGRGTRGRLAAQTTFTTSPVPLDATPLADVAYMDPPLSIWPVSRSGDLPPAIDLAQQPALAKRGSPRMNLKDKSETLDDESQVAARTDFVFGREGANDESMTEFGLVQRMEKETRLAAVDDIVSILFLWERLVEGLAEWSWLLPCSDLGLGWCQQEAMSVPCV